MPRKITTKNPMKGKEKRLMDKRIANLKTDHRLKTTMEDIAAEYKVPEALIAQIFDGFFTYSGSSFLKNLNKQGFKISEQKFRGILGELIKRRIIPTRAEAANSYASIIVTEAIRKQAQTMGESTLTARETIMSHIKSGKSRRFISYKKMEKRIKQLHSKGLNPSQITKQLLENGFYISSQTVADILRYLKKIGEL